MPEIAKRPEQVDLQWLTEAFRASGVLPAGDARVTKIEYEIIGTGKMGDNARFRLGYEGDAGGAPATVVGKFAATDETARMMAGAQGAYYSEVMFYRLLAPVTSMRTPQIYVNEIDDNRIDFITIMEDLAPAAPGSQLQGESRAHTDIVMQQAARLAAAFYGDESIAAMDHVITAARDDGGAFGEELLKQYWPAFKERFAEQISAECLAFGDRYVESHRRFVTLELGPGTLVHGDLRSENILFDDRQATVVDWQTVSESSPLADLAYFMGGSVDTEDRRSWERELVSAYREELARLGVGITEDDCWKQYRAQAMHGLMITILGACFTEPAERSDAMFLAMIQRHLQHCVDLEADTFFA